MVRAIGTASGKANGHSWLLGSKMKPALQAGVAIELIEWARGTTPGLQSGEPDSYQRAVFVASNTTHGLALHIPPTQ